MGSSVSRGPTCWQVLHDPPKPSWRGQEKSSPVSRSSNPSSSGPRSRLAHPPQTKLWRTHTPPSPLCRNPRVLCHKDNGIRRKHLKLSSAPSSHTLAMALILSYLCKVNPSTYAQGAKIKGKERSSNSLYREISLMVTLDRRSLYEFN